LALTASESDSFFAHEVPLSGAPADGRDLSANSLEEHGSGITVPDAALLFSGDYKRSGEDLIISGSSQKFIIGNYFRGEHHKALYSPDGASLSGEVVDALIGDTRYAQADPGASAVAPIGHVVKLTGNASVLRNGVAVVLNVGDNVFKGDVVQSGTDSALGITFIDGTVFSLSSNARMVLNDMVYDPGGASNASLLSLVQGTISFVAGETAKHGNMKVDTPVATMGIRGTAVLVEISADNGPTKFSVLVEPGDVTGSFVLYDRYTGATLGSVSQAGLMTLVTPSGQNRFTITEQLKTLGDLLAEKDIVHQVFSIAYPQFNLDDSNPHTTTAFGSGVTPFGDLGFYKLAADLVPQPVKLAGTALATTSNASQDPLFFLHQAQILVTDVSATQSSLSNLLSFTISPHVTISDPIPSDVTVPFVPGSAHLLGAAGPASIPAGFDLLSLVSVDPATGVVTYDPSSFSFLGVNEVAQYVIAFESQVGNALVPETLRFTIKGLVDVPVLSTADVHLSLNEIPGKTGSSDPITQTASLNFQDPVFSDVGSSYSVSVLNVVATGVTTGLPHDPTTLNAVLASYLTPSVLKNSGSTNGVINEVFSAPEKAFDYLAAGETVDLVYTIQIKSPSGATSTESLTVAITGVNHPPVLDADTVAVHPVVEQPGSGSTQPTIDVASGSLAFSDVVLSDTHTSSAAFASDVVSGGGVLPSAALAALQSAITTGIATDSTGAGSGTLIWNFSAPEHLFDFLRAGQTLSLTYDVTINDNNGGVANGMSATQPVTVVVTGTNNVPQIVGEADPAPVVVQAYHAVTTILPPGTDANALGLSTETFDSQTAGSASDNGAGFGTFFSAALDANFSGSGNAGVVNGSSAVTEAPFVGPLPGSLDTSNYLSICTNGTETIKFNQIENTFGLYWGSVESLNSIAFYNGSTLVGSYSGSDLSPLLANGDDFSLASAGYVQFAQLPSFNTVVLQSAQTTLEVDNISAGFLSPTGGSPLGPVTGTLTATDTHIGDTLTASVIGAAAIEYNGSTTLPADANVSNLIAASAISFDTVTSDGGAELLHWVYNPEAAVNFLNPGDTLTITYLAQINDGSGSVGSQPLTITVVGDSGALTVASGGALEVSNSVESGVTFLASTGALTLDNPSGFAGSISGFSGNGTLAGSDQIDLKNIDYNSISFSEHFDPANDTLSVSDGTTSAFLHFNGSYVASNFAFVSDGHGGTVVYDPPVPSQGGQNVSQTSTAAATTNNTIIASVANETLIGSSNANTFVFNFAGVGHENVNNFHPEIDVLQFSPGLFATTQAILAAIRDDGHGNAVIALDAHDTITLAGISKAQLSPTDFHLA
jgi:FecR protein